MKLNKFISVLFVCLLVAVTGCSKKDNPVSSTNNGGGGIIGGGGNTGGGNGAVTFQIQTQAGQNGGTEFDATPSTNVTITEIDVSESTGSNFQDQIQGDGTTVYQGGTSYSLTEYTGVQSGMKFTFEFIGKTSPGGQDFDVNSNYTVP